MDYRQNPEEKKSPLNKRSIHISGPKLNILASILKVLKIFSGVTVASKYGPLTRIEKQAMS